MRIVGIDPGTHTGCAWWESWDGWTAGQASLQSCTFVAKSGLVVEEVSSVVLPVVNWVLEVDPDLVVIEDFTLRGTGSVKSSKKEGISPARIAAGIVTGLLLGERWRVGGEIAFQQPSEMSALTNERLRGRGVWVPDKGGVSSEHRRDAWRHIIVALTKRRLVSSAG